MQHFQQVLSSTDFLFAQAISNYQGGSNPLLIIIAIILLAVAVLSSLAYAVFSLYKKSRCTRMLESDLFTGRERGFLRSYFRRLKIHEPLEILSERIQYDGFVNDVAHLYEVTEVPIDVMREEGRVFHGVRKTLLLKHSFFDPILSSTRALPQNYLVAITFLDENSGKFHHLSATVSENREFFLALSVPDDPVLDDLIRDMGKLELTLEFSRRKDAQYHATSHLIRVVGEHDKIWMVSHSKKIGRSPLRPPLNIAGSMLIAGNNDEVFEYPVKVANVNNLGCILISEVVNGGVERKAGVVVNFEVEGQALACRGLIDDIFMKKEKHIYQIGFRLLDSDINQLLIVFQRQLRAKYKKEDQEFDKKNRLLR